MHEEETADTTQIGYVRPKTVPVAELGTKETAIASAIVPYDRDDVRAMYFGYRASGLSVRETLNIIHRSKPWLSMCRLDPEFVDLESRIPEFRKELSKEYIDLEFTRNMRLIFEKDRQVIKKSMDSNQTLTKFEHDYLLKARGMYTPTQLQILEAIVGGKVDEFNFADLIANHPDIVQMSRTDTVTVAKAQTHEEVIDG